MSLQAPKFYTPIATYLNGLSGGSVAANVPWVETFDAVPTGLQICVLVEPQPTSPSGLYVLVPQTVQGVYTLSWKFALSLIDLCAAISTASGLQLYLSVAATQAFPSGSKLWLNGQTQAGLSVSASPGIWVVAQPPVSGGGGGITTLAAATDYASAPLATANTSVNNRFNATEAVANAALPAAQKGAASGVASLGSDSKVPQGQLTGKIATTDLTDGSALNIAVTNAGNAAAAAQTTAASAASTAAAAQATANAAAVLGTTAAVALAATATVGSVGTAADSGHAHPLPGPLDIGAIPAVRGTWNASTNQAFDANSTLLGALVSNTVPLSTWPVAFRVSVAGSTSMNGITNWLVNDVIYQTNPAWARSPALAQVLTTSSLLKGDNNGGVSAAVAGVDYTGLSLLQRGVPAVLTGQFVFGANGAVNMGYTPGANTLTLDNTGAGGLTGRTATLAVATLAGTSADNGKVVTLDNGKTFTITAFSSTTVATGTLSAVCSSVTQPIWYLNGQFTGGILGTNGLTFSATSGSGVTATAAVATFTSAALDVGKIITIDGGKLFTVTAFTSTTVVVGTISGGTLSTTTFAAGSWIYGWSMLWQFNSFSYSDGAWIYYPANSITSSNTAGFYWTVMTNGIAGTVYNLTYTPGSAFTSPSSAAVTAAAFSSAAGTVQYNTANVEITCDSVVVAGNSMGRNGRLMANNFVRNDVSTFTKAFRTYYGIYNIYSAGPQSTGATAAQSSLLWLGRTNRQVGYQVADIATTTGNTPVTTIDSTVNQNYQNRLNLSNQVGWVASEFTSLIAYPAA